MTFAVFTNLLLTLLCAAVLVQCTRMMRSFRAIKSGDLGETVAQLDRATGQARAVLGELKTLLATDGAANARVIASGEALRDELSVMVGIGNAVAERIMDAAATASDRKDQPADEADVVAEAIAEAAAEAAIDQPVVRAAPRKRSRSKPKRPRPAVTAVADDGAIPAETVAEAA